jgi:hypothetical protein
MTLADPEKQAEARLSRAEVELNIWASCWWHEIYGALGYPKLEECLIDPYFVQGWPEPVVERKGGRIVCLDPDPRRLESAGIEIVEEPYQTDRRRYSANGLSQVVNDQRSKMSKQLVDKVLVDIGWPPVLVGLLLWIYPTTGRYAVDRGENPYRGYRPPEFIEKVTGRIYGHYMDRALDGIFRQLEREFYKELRMKLK